MLQQVQLPAPESREQSGLQELRVRVESLELRATATEQRTAEHAELLQEHDGRLERQEERIAAAETLAREARQHAERRLALAAAAVTVMFLVLKAIGFF